MRGKNSLIRAVIKNGTIQALDPLPPNWREGEILIVEPAAEAPSATDLDRWYDELMQAARMIPPDDFDRVDAALAAADREAKELVRRQMGLQA